MIELGRARAAWVGGAGGSVEVELGHDGWKIVGMIADEGEPEAAALLEHYPHAIVVSP